MSEDQSSVVTLKVRVTPEFREKIVETAKANNRSMNQEIVHRLEQSFTQESTTLLTSMTPEAHGQALIDFANQKKLNKSDKVLISREHLHELLEIKQSLKNLSLAILDLEKHSIDLENEGIIEK